MRNFVVIRSQFGTCHDTSAVMTCAQLWPNSIITNIDRTRRMVTRFQWWAHKLLAKCPLCPYTMHEVMMRLATICIIYVQVVWHGNIHCTICWKRKQYEWYWSVQVQFYQKIGSKCKDKSTSYQFKLSCACCGLVQDNFTLTLQGYITCIGKFPYVIVPLTVKQSWKIPVDISHILYRNWYDQNKKQQKCK